jgi:hypothetical protein
MSLLNNAITHPCVVINSLGERDETCLRIVVGRSLERRSQRPFGLQLVFYCSNSRIAMSTDHRSQNNPRGVVSVSGAVRVTADYRERYWNATGKRDRHYTIQTENIKHFEWRAVSERTVRKHSRWIIATCCSTRNLCIRIYLRDHFLVCEQNSSTVRGCTAYPT